MEAIFLIWLLLFYLHLGMDLGLVQDHILDHQHDPDGDQITDKVVQVAFTCVGKLEIEGF